MLAYFVNCKLDISTEFNTFSNLTGINKTILLTDTSVGNSLLCITLTLMLSVCDDVIIYITVYYTYWTIVLSIIHIAVMSLPPSPLLQRTHQQL